jgi:putative ABC transport system permease protein
VNALMRKSLADITRRKGRTLLAILGIFIGVLGLAAMNEANDVISGAFFYSTDAQAFPNVTFVVNALPTSVAATLQHLPNVAQFQLRTTYNTRWYPASGGTTIVEINGYQAVRQDQLGAFQITSGRWPGRGEIAMDVSDRALQPIALGDTVIVDAPDGSRVSLHIVGLARTRGLAVWHPAAPAIAYMSADALQELVHDTHGPILNDLPRGTQILIKTHNANNPLAMCNSITQVLGDAHLTIAFSQCRYSSFDADAQLHVTGLLTIIRLLAWLSLLLVCMMIFTSVSTLLVEQIKIIGTMKALGGTRFAIGRSYLMTVGMYSVAGTVLGCGIGLVAGYQLAVFLTSTVQMQVGDIALPVDVGTFQVAPWTLADGILVGLLVPLCSALWPLWTGMRITIREAISAYGLRATGATTATSLRAWGRHLSFVPQIIWLGLRGLFRRPARTLMTLLALMLSGATFLAVQITNDSLAANASVGNYNSDFRITLTDNQTTVPSQPVIHALQSLSNVETIEPIDQTVITIARRELMLDGLLAQTQLYQPHLVAGRWLHTNEQNTLVINDNAAQQLHLQVGAQVIVDTTFTREAHQEQKATWTIVGIVHDVNEVGPLANPQGRLGVAFTTLDNLNRTLRHLPTDAAWRVWLQARDHAPQALNHLNEQIYSTFHQLGLQGAYTQSTSQDPALVTGVQTIIFVIFEAMALLVALVGGLGLALALTASVIERRLEIGMLRALGATGWRVGTIFCIEGLSLAVLAWGLGAVLGLPGGMAIVNLFGPYFGPIDVSFHLLLLLAMLPFIGAVSLAASFGPALSASRMRVRGILRHE